MGEIIFSFNFIILSLLENSLFNTKGLSFSLKIIEFGLV